MKSSIKLFRIKTIEKVIKRYSSTDRPYSTALGVLPEYYDEPFVEERVQDTIMPYEAIPGPKGLPFLGNSWRFAPLIGIISSIFISDIVSNFIWF